MSLGAAMAYTKSNSSGPKRAKRAVAGAARATGAPRTEMVNVASPTVPGATERLSRVVDTLHVMLRRDQISERQYWAGERYRTSLEKLGSSPGGAMDFERPRGGSLPGSPPSPAMLYASDDVHQAENRLYRWDFEVVHLICGVGMTIEEAAANLYGSGVDGKPFRQCREDCGRRLREGLRQLADLWFPEQSGEGARTRSIRLDRATITDAAEVPKAASVVHATGNRIFRSGGK